MLMPTIDVAKQIIHYATVLMFTYACSILTIALSSILLTSIPMPLSKELSTPANVTTDSIVPDALPNNVMISTDDLYNDYNQTECTFDFDDDSILDRLIDDDDTCCNFTIDFPLPNNFKLETKTNENFYFGFFQKHSTVPLVW